MCRVWDQGALGEVGLGAEGCRAGLRDSTEAVGGVTRRILRHLAYVRFRQRSQSEASSLKR